MASGYAVRRRRRDQAWSLVQYLAFIVAALGGILFVVIPIHESIHYGLAILLGLHPTMRIGLGWGYVMAPGASPMESLLVGSGPMIFEGFMGSMLLRRGVATAGSQAFGFGLAFGFNLFNSLVNLGQSDFWHLWHLGYGAAVSLAIGVAILLGTAIGAPRIGVAYPKGA